MIQTAVKTVGVFCAASDRVDAAYSEMALQFGRWLGGQGMTLVYGGAASGLMESVARGVKECGGRVVGVVPRILEEHGRVSRLIDEAVPCRDLNDRKAVMAERSDVLVALPGGVGTLDEVFTVMAAHSIGYHTKRVILFDTSGFWDGLAEVLQAMDARRFINMPLERCLSLARSWQELEELFVTVSVR